MNSLANATISNRIDITKDLVIFHVTPDAGVPKFLGGQYVALGLPGNAPRYEGAPEEATPPAPEKLIKRAYSIGSSSEVAEHLEFYVAIVPDGALTSRLAVLKQGDRVYVAPKITGTFTIDVVPSERNLIFVSTGTGIAPYMSMLRTASTWATGRKIVLAHGVRFPQDLAYSDELQRFEAERAGFRYLPIVSRADDGFRGKRGRVTSMFDDGTIELDPATDRVFLCGNPAMIDELETSLKARGYEVHSKKNPTGKLHLEKYW